MAVTAATTAVMITAIAIAVVRRFAHCGGRARRLHRQHGRAHGWTINASVGRVRQNAGFDLARYGRQAELCRVRVAINRTGVVNERRAVHTTKS